MELLRFNEEAMTSVIMSCLSTTVYELKSFDETLETIRTGGRIANYNSLQELTAKIVQSGTNRKAAFPKTDRRPALPAAKHGGCALRWGR